MKRWLSRAAWFALITLAGLLAFDRYVAVRAAPRIHHDPVRVPEGECILLPGTNKYLARGKENWYYRYRIDAALRLYRAGKAEAILISGDGRSRHYDEVARMRRDLLRRGVPPGALREDRGGLRTYLSLLRAKERFGCRRPLIVSQPFHLERALFIARALGMKAEGYAAAAPEGTPAARRMRLREIAARARMAWDLLSRRILERLSRKETTE
jgi:SanA protein